MVWDPYSTLCPTVSFDLCFLLSESPLTFLSTVEICVMIWISHCLCMTPYCHVLSQAITQEVQQSQTESKANTNKQDITIKKFIIYWAPYSFNSSDDSAEEENETFLVTWQLIYDRAWLFGLMIVNKNISKSACWGCMRWAKTKKESVSIHLFHLSQKGRTPDDQIFHYK